jgi:hypothetical protein
MHVMIIAVITVILAIADTGIAAIALHAVIKTKTTIKL